MAKRGRKPTVYNKKTGIPFSVVGKNKIMSQDSGKVFTLERGTMFDPDNYTKKKPTQKKDGRCKRKSFRRGASRAWVTKNGQRMADEARGVDLPRWILGSRMVELFKDSQFSPLIDRIVFPDSYESPGKQEAREKVGKIISRRFKRPISALMLPRAGFWDVRVWGDLGVRFKDSIAVEREQKEAELMHAHTLLGLPNVRNFNVQVGEFSQVLDTCLEEGRVFDVIDMDFCGPMNETTIEMLRTVVDNKMARVLLLTTCRDERHISNPHFKQAHLTGANIVRAKGKRVLSFGYEGIVEKRHKMLREVFVMKGVGRG